MKFVDEVRIHVKAGDGGDGAVAWRREKFIPRGGPAGGDGGDGGDVVLVVDPQLMTLLDYRYVREHLAKSGGHGMGSDMNGRNGPPLELHVPPGTLVRDVATDEVLADLAEPGQRMVVAKGGKGGLGNMNFATSTNQAPRFAEKGTEGEEKDLVLELKLLADVGLLGFPNAGKSTLISRVSRARPKVADYPFTTLIPNLGVVPYKDGTSFVMADIPGLIEGAAEGAGLGHQFLRHVERTRVLVHLVDMAAPGEERSPIRDYEVLNAELARYSPELASKPQLVAPSKMDLTEAKERLPAFRAALAERGIRVFPISAATGEGVGALLDAIAQVLSGGVVPSSSSGPRPRRRPRRDMAEASSVPVPASARTSGKGTRPAAAPAKRAKTSAGVKASGTRTRSGPKLRSASKAPTRKTGGRPATKAARTGSGKRGKGRARR